MYRILHGTRWGMLGIACEGFHESNFIQDADERFKNLNLNKKYEDRKDEKNGFNNDFANNNQFYRTSRQFSEPEVPKYIWRDSWTNSKIDCISSSNLSLSDLKTIDHSVVKYQNDKRKPFSISNRSSNTLSIHIEAYENFERFAIKDGSVDVNVFSKTSFTQKSKNAKTGFFITTEVPFEYPRQNENENLTLPEIMQFKSTQRLFSPAATPRKKPKIVILPPPTPTQPQSSQLHDNSMQPTTEQVHSNTEIIKSREQLLIAENTKLRELCAQLTEKSKQENDYQLKLKIVRQEQRGFKTLPRTTQNRIVDDGWNLLQRTYGSMANDVAVAICEQRNLKVMKQPKLQETRKNFKVLKTKFKRHEVSHLKQTEKLIQGHEQKVEDFESVLTISQDEVEQCNKLLKEAKERQLNDAEMIKDLEEKCQRLEIEASKKNEKVVQLKVNKKYTDEAKLTFIELKNCHVADERVGKTIQSVLNLAGLKANALPSATTVARSHFLAKVLIKEQLYEVLKNAAEAAKPVTICTDETTKKAKKEVAFIARILDENNQPIDMLMAVRRQLDKGAWTTFAEFKNVTEEIGGKYLEGNEMWKMFLLSITHRMSDQASTEMKFTDCLVQARKEFIEKMEIYDNLTDQQKKELAQISSFFCQLHVAHNSTDIVLKALLMHEKDLREIETLPKTTVMLCITEVCRYLAERAASKWMVKPLWESFAQHHGIKYYSIPDLIGHRFDIILAIAGTVFPLKDGIIKFLDEHKSNMSNSSVKEWLKDPIVLTHLQIMALINVVITGPYLRLTENSNDMNSFTSQAQSLIIYLGRLQKEPLLLFSGETPFYDFPESYPKTERSKYHAEVMLEQSPLYPELAVDAVELIADGLIDYFKKKFADFLPGGKYYGVEFNSSGIPRTNRKCEMIFGFTGWTHQYAPNMRLARREMRVQWAVNNVNDWLMKKSEEERNKLIRRAVAEAYIEEKGEHDRVKQLDIAFWNKMQEKKAEEITLQLGLERKKAEALKVLEEKFGGVWNTVEQMNNYLTNMPEKKKIQAVKANIRYHKFATKHDDKKLTTVSRKSKDKPIEELITNLTILINNSAQNMPEVELYDSD